MEVRKKCFPKTGEIRGLLNLSSDLNQQKKRGKKAKAEKD